MAFIPNSNLRVLRNVSLDNTYKDTMDFPDASTQATFFMGKVKYSYDDFTYIKENTVRINANAENLYDCNYIMFQNTNFGAKWFYAFITGIEFKSAEMTLVTYEIDVMQTWQFEMQIGQCFVEREHVSDDTIGEHTYPEGLETGEYTCAQVGYQNSGDPGYLVLHSNAASLGGLRGIVEGVFSGLKTVLINDANSLAQRLEEVDEAGDGDAVVSIQQIPYFSYVPQSFSVYRPASILGYTPKNNKLFTHPYIFVNVTNGEGGNNNYRFEFFRDGIGEFRFIGNTSAHPAWMCYPYFYKGVEENFEESLLISNFPVCSWSSDTFKNWYAQNQSSLTISNISATAGTVVGTMASAATGNVMGVVSSMVSGVSEIAGNLAQVEDHRAIPDSSKGQIAGDYLRAKLGKIEFRLSIMTIQPEYARIIDDYFSVYGYKVCRVKTPNTKGRPSWNYVKTIDAVVTGSIPFNDTAKIRSILDAGTTFWHGDYVGDYSRANK